MNTQSRIYVTLSPRIRKALDLCAALDGSTAASYAANVLSVALLQEIEKNAVLHERWQEMEREVLQRGSWDELQLPFIEKLDEAPTASKEMKMKSWFLAGSHPYNYESGVDSNETYNGRSSGYLRSKETNSTGFGTLMQMFKADSYRNKRLRFSAYVKSEDIVNWAGLWMRIDGPKSGRGESPKMLGFDNMQNRPIKGTTDWQQYSVVLDVPQESINIAFGILLDSSGEVWINSVQFEEVGTAIPTTDLEQGQEKGLIQDKPENLDFAE